jgi:hypothetical protein
VKAMWWPPDSARANTLNLRTDGEGV